MAGRNIQKLFNSHLSQDRELQDVLDQYRRISSDRDSVESKYRVTNEESQTLRAELAASDSERKRLTDKISTLEREISDHLRVGLVQV